MARYAEVAVDFPDDRARTFTYEVPVDAEAEPGDVVWVPFGPQTRQGIVFETTDVAPQLEEVRPILHVASGGPFIDRARLEVVRWMAEHYRSTLFNSAALMLPTGAASRLRTWITRAEDIDDEQLSALRPRERKAWDLASADGKRTRKDRLARRLGRGGEAVVDRLIRRRLFRATAEWERARVQPLHRDVLELGISASDAEALADEYRAGRQSKRADLADWLVDGGPGTKSEVAGRFGQAATKWAVDTGMARLVRERVLRDPLSEYVVQGSFPLDPTAEQAGAINAIETDLARPSGTRPATFLLFGVTGSGKTEVYLQAAARCIEQGRRVMILVPEIALTPQTLQRFASRFPGRVALLHSGLTDGERFDQWWRVSEGAYDIVLGSRGAVFAPMEKLGLVILDEEHEWTYKQHDQSPRYHARDVAERLCGETGATLLLGSATPDVGTFRRTERGEIRLLRLGRRVGVAVALAGDKPPRYDEPGKPSRYEEAGSVAGFTGVPVPMTHDAAGRARVELVDMRQELRDGHAQMLSRRLLDAMKLTLDAGERVILFLNRRGTAAFVQCADCGTIRKCRRCDTSLTYHQATRREKARLECHYCGYTVHAGRACPVCKGKQVSRHGPGTQAVEEAVGEFFPRARTLRWDSDSARSARDHIRIMEEFVSGDARVLVGTQMIAKGLDIPSVTLVGVVSADTGLAIPDFRAGERAFQVLAQVAGRAGRGALPGRVVIQTFQPEHYAVQAAALQDYELFYEAEIDRRARYNDPPFTRVIRLWRSDPNQSEAHRVAHEFVKTLREERERRGESGVEVFGPTPAFPFRLRGMYRWQVVLRSARPESLLDKVSVGRGWSVDVEPVSMT